MEDRRIAKIQVIPLSVKSLNWDQSTVLICIEDEAGRIGIGESDGPLEAVKHYLQMESAHGWQQNINDILIGRDPLEFVANYNAMYEGQIWVGRRGLGLMAISGIDMALYDLAGKQLKVPAYKLLGGAVRDIAVPYATLYPSIDTNASATALLDVYKELISKAKELEFRAIKLAIMPNKEITDAILIDFINELRDFSGFDIEMGVDFLYRWQDPYKALRTLKKLESTQLMFAEAVLQHDQLRGHKILSEKMDTPLCGAEMATGRHEVKEWIHNSGVAIVQPDVNRCGGLTELRKIAEYAEMCDVEIAPHGWKTGISAAAGIHFNLSVANSAYFEYLHPDLYESPLRKYLLSKEPELDQGVFQKPESYGFGIELNKDYINQILK